ncbi:MAG: 23S rRNA (adenine(2503)-C(2))-methyltransferase RlmN [Chloroflexia bacterium]|nr:23S rRNA (adenine(2503)-C(2))-methyltransferase RlmN [Chloroflexia bacterium]
MTHEKATYLLDLSVGELEDLVQELGQKSFRARQIWRWLYVHLAGQFEDMTNLSVALRQKLAQHARCSALQALQEEVSADGQTRKVLLGLADGERIETVLMLYDERATVCVSTQVGCAIGCPFCATGQGGFRRDLSTGEIVEQVLYFARWLRDHGPAGLDRVGNVVFMGMGEPLANYEATWKAIETMHDPQGLNLGARRFTVSTAGLVPGILRLAEEDLPVNLAISLHAATDELRDQLVPVNRRYPLEELLRAVRAYLARTNRRVTFEYALIAGINTAITEAHRLADRLRGLLCHVNLIPLNPVPDSRWQPPPDHVVREWQLFLQRAHIPVSVRLERGTEIAAACGQLRGHSKAPKGKQSD